MDAHVTPTEAAALIGCSTITISRAIKAGKLEATRIGTSDRSPLRISTTELHRFMRQNGPLDLLRITETRA